MNRSGEASSTAKVTDEELFILFPSRRSVVHSTRGIVACANPLAAEAGLRILREGGNAADAAIATAAALNVTDPSMTGIGGDVFCHFYDASSGRVRSLNGSGRSAAAATLEAVCDALGLADDPDRAAREAIPRTSVHAVTVPGAAAAWVDVVERFGSGKLDLGRVLAPAMEMAEVGVPVSKVSAYLWAITEHDLKTTSPNGHELLKEDPAAPGGFRAPREGEIFGCPLLASTFRRLAEHGKDGFYKGPVAEAIVAATKSKGGFLALEDLEYHARQGSLVGEAISLKLGKVLDSQEDEKGEEGENSVNGLEIWEHPPNGQGIVALMALGILQELEKAGKIEKLSTLGHNSTRYLHAVIESLRIAFADAAWFVTDPDRSPVSPERLIALEYLAERAKLFDPDKASYLDTHGSPPPALHASDTVYLAVTDCEGNGCSLVNSLSDRFGSCIVAQGTGVALQNRGSNFQLDRNHPNVLAPRKRAYNTIVPAVVTRTKVALKGGDDEGPGSLWAVFGVMGGFMQPQGHVQVLLNIAAFGFDSQSALDAPRVCIGAPVPGKSIDPDKVIDMTVYLEEGISDEVVRELETLGHEVKVVTGQARSLFGRGQVITVNHDAVTGQRVYSAGSDGRADGVAAPL